MAYIFMLGVNCGTEDQAVEYANYLRAVSSDPLAHGLDFGIDVGTCMEDEEWWADAIPSHPETKDHLWGSGGPGSEQEAVRMGEAGQKLYGLLKAGPDFRYAAVAVEATSGMSLAELMGTLKESRDFGYPGLVLAREIWHETGSPPGFQPFARGYVWIPYAGERFGR